MIVRRSALIALACALVLDLVAGPAAAVPQRTEEQIKQEMAGLAWQRGPIDGRIGSVASIKVEEGKSFLDGPNTRHFLELNGNPPRNDRYALVAPQSDWFAIFFFEDTGYVKDDDKLDPPALLAALKEGDKAANTERERLGMAPLHTDGWHVPPHYDLTTKRLEWGVRLRGGSSDRTVVNYSIRLLGRRGVMHAILVSEPETLDRDIAEFKAALGGFDFVGGERYAEFRSGDRIAEYGLAALVLGGAAAVATKSGFGKAIGKFVVVGVAALGSAIVALFRRRRS